MLIDKKLIILSILLIFSINNSYCYSTDIRIGLQSLNRPVSLTVGIHKGEFYMKAGALNIKLEENDNILINRAGDSVILSHLKYGTVMVDSVVLTPLDSMACFLVRNNLIKNDKYEYYGSLIIRSDLTSLLVINEIDIDRYLMGVVQAEAGFRGGLEYFKTQALLARTYLYMNINKHSSDGFNICDNTHCQVYKGRSEEEIIKNAVSLTRGQVLVNTDSMLVFTPFHSNCGGETESPDNVWLSSMPHLVKVTDPYCSFSGNARWSRYIALDEWIEYLEDHGYHHNNNNDLAFNQYTRQKEYRIGDFTYPLTNIREDWGFKSAFFSVTLRDSTLYIEGRGYGHGVGLCQEGARVMADRGFSMNEITGFYFNNLIIIDIKDVKPVNIINSPF